MAGLRRTENMTTAPAIVPIGTIRQMTAATPFWLVACRKKAATADSATKVHAATATYFANAQKLTNPNAAKGIARNPDGSFFSALLSHSFVSTKLAS